MKLNINKLVIKTIFILLISTISTVISECNLKQGCLMRKKFLTYVTYQDKHGTPIPSKTMFNNKIIYVFLDKLVIYSSSKAADPRIEPEVSVNKKEDEENIERIINFGEIILDCGKTHNKLCHISEYNGLMEKPIFASIKKTITNSPDIKCVVLPFFENGYKQIHEKMSFMCVNEAKQIIELIEFKNSVSRLIEDFQSYLSRDRYSAFNGLLRKQGKFITFKANKPVPVIARLYGKSIDLISNDEKAMFIDSFSLYQLRHSNSFFVKTLLKKNILKSDWNSQFESKPSDKCCLSFPGEKDTLYLCAADTSGKQIEMAEDICIVKLREFLKQSRIILHGIKLYENFYQLTLNKKKLSNCKSKEYNIFYERIQNAIDYAILKDCIINNEYNTDTEENKFAYCFKHFGDEIKLEVKLLAFNNDNLFNSMSDCVYKKIFTDKLTEAYLRKVLAQNQKKPQSFLQLEETNDYDEDDSEEKIVHDGPTSDPSTLNIVNESHHSSDELHFGIITDDSVLNGSRNNDNLDPNTDELNVLENPTHNDFKFMQVQKSSEEKRSEKKKKKLGIMDIAYSRPKKYKTDDMNRVNVYRQNKMNDLQKTHQWHHSLREGIDMSFNKGAASGGKKNADSFVSFLGFLRDASHKASFNINELEIQKYFSK